MSHIDKETSFIIGETGAGKSGTVMPILQRFLAQAVAEGVDVAELVARWNAQHPDDEITFVVEEVHGAPDFDHLEAGRQLMIAGHDSRIHLKPVVQWQYPTIEGFLGMDPELRNQMKLITTERPA